jgi:hypothetical protein
VTIERRAPLVLVLVGAALTVTEGYAIVGVPGALAGLSVTSGAYILGRWAPRPAETALGVLLIAFALGLDMGWL